MSTGWVVFLYFVVFDICGVDQKFPYIGKINILFWTNVLMMCFVWLPLFRKTQFNTCFPMLMNNTVEVVCHSVGDNMKKICIIYFTLSRNL